MEAEFPHVILAEVWLPLNLVINRFIAASGEDNSPRLIVLNYFLHGLGIIHQRMSEKQNKSNASVDKL